MLRREFLRLLALAAAGGATLRPALSRAQAAGELYDVPRFGNVSLLHITDVHAQLLPTYFREPSVNIGDSKPPHLGRARYNGLTPSRSRHNQAVRTDVPGIVHASRAWAAAMVWDSIVDSRR